MWPKTCFIFTVARAHCSLMFSLLPVQASSPFLQKIETNGQIWTNSVQDIPFDSHCCHSTGTSDLMLPQYITLGTLTLEFLMQRILHCTNFKQEDQYDGKNNLSGIKQEVGFEQRIQAQFHTCIHFLSAYDRGPRQKSSHEHIITDCEYYVCHGWHLINICTS